MPCFLGFISDFQFQRFTRTDRLLVILHFGTTARGGYIMNHQQACTCIGQHKATFLLLCLWEATKIQFRMIDGYLRFCTL